MYGGGSAAANNLMNMMGFGQKPGQRGGGGMSKRDVEGNVNQ